MIIDSSALVAVVRGEPGADRFFRALSDRREPKRMSAANYLEAAIVIDGARSPIASRREISIARGDRTKCFTCIAALSVVKFLAPSAQLSQSFAKS